MKSHRRTIARASVDSTAMTGMSLDHHHMWLESDTRTCLDLIERGVATSLGEINYGRYLDLLRAVRAKVYANHQPLEDARTKNNRGSAATVNAGLPSLENTHNSPQQQAQLTQGFDGAMPLLGEEIDSYLSRVGDFLDDGSFGLDEGLNDWYATLMQGTWDNNANSRNVTGTGTGVVENAWSWSR